MTPQTLIAPNEGVTLEPYLRDLPQIDTLPWCGEVTATVGLLIESHGPAVAIGDFCEVFTNCSDNFATPNPQTN